MTDHSSDPDPVNQLAEAFLARYRRGERPSMTEYTDQHPELAEQIRDLFPALVVMEQFGSVAGHPETPSDTSEAEGRQMPRQLGEYRILREVGRGGMGVVYEAVQESLGRHVALKVLAFHGLVKPTYLERFGREARAAARLHHTNIVPVFGIGEHQGIHYYAMQFIQGQSLDAVLKEVRRLRKSKDTPPPEPSPTGGGRAGRGEPGRELTVSIAHSLLTGVYEAPQAAVGQTFLSARQTGTSAPQPDGIISSTSEQDSGLASQPEAQYFRSVARLAAQVAEALDYAHKQGILHRDIKPSNLLLDTRGTVWITDFGLVKAEGSDELTSPGDIVGTVRYMAPERFQGRADPGNDVYGLGITLYELLTLRPAFEDANRARLIERVTHDDPPRPRKLDPHVPRDLETIVLKAIAKEPARRYAGAEELAEDLRRFLADRPIRARRASSLEKMVRWCRRNPALAALLAGLLLAVSAVAAVSTVAAFKLKDERDQVQRAKGERDVELAKKVVALERAQEAEKKTTIELYKSYLAQAQASSWSGRPGRRLDGLDALAMAAKILRSLHFPDETPRVCQLRNAAIAAMALTDIRLAREWESGVERVSGCVFDAQQERYAVSDPQGNVSVRRMVDGREIVRLPNPGRGRHAYRLQFSPDGRMLVATHDGEWIWHLWDLNRGKKILSLAAGSLDFAPDGRKLACVLEKSNSNKDSSIVIYSLDTLQEIRRWPIGEGGHTILFAPDGKRLAFLNDKPPSLQLLDTKTGAVLRDWPAPVFGGLIPACWRDDGGRLAFAFGKNGISVWDVEKGRQVLQFRVSETVLSDVAYSHEGTVLATNGWDHGLRLWNAETGRLLLATPAPMHRLQFSPDGRSIGPMANGTSGIGTWQFAASKELISWQGCPENQHIDRITISTSGRWLAAACTDGVRIWDLPARREVAYLAGNATKVAFLPDESGLIVVGPPGSFLWPMVHGSRDGDSTLQIGPPRSLGSPPLVPGNWMSERKVSLLPDGQNAIVSEPAWGQIVRLDLKSGRRFQLVGNLNMLSAMASSPDGRWLATSFYWFPEQPVKIWDLQTGMRVRDLPLVEHATLAFSPDSQWLVTATKSEFRFWKAGDWSPGRAVERKPGSPLHDPAFSTDGQLLALALAPDSVQLSDPRTGNEYGVLPVLTEKPITSMCFSPDGGQLVISTEREILLWDLRRIRRQLKNMDLDWDAPPPPPEPSPTSGGRPGKGDSESARPIQVKVEPGDATMGNPNGSQRTAPPASLHDQLALYSMAIAIAPLPFHPEPYHQRGHVYENLGEPRQAVDDFSAALLLLRRPANPKIQAHLHAARGKNYRQLKNYEKAAADFEKTLEFDPQAVEVCNDLAWQYVTGPENLRNPKKALPLAKRAVDLRPNQWDLLNTLGVVYYRLGRYAEAIETLQSSLLHTGGRTDAFDLFFLAMCHTRLDDHAKARDCYDRAVKWVQEQQGRLSPEWTEELTKFRAEAEAVLASASAGEENK